METTNESRVYDPFWRTRNIRHGRPRFTATKSRPCPGARRSRQPQLLRHPRAHGGGQPGDPRAARSGIGRCRQSGGRGADVEGFEPGEAVIVTPGFPVDAADWQADKENSTASYYPGGTFNHGGYAQYMLIHQRWLLKDNRGLPAEELATIPLVLVTAMHNVSTLGKVGPGTRVLIHAGVSGSGSMAIRVAKALGASVII